MTSSTNAALEAADDAVLAQTPGFAIVSRPSPWHTIVAVLGIAALVGGSVGFDAVAAAIAPNGEPSTFAPILLIVVGAYMVIYGALGIRRSLRRWTTPEGASLDRVRHRLPGTDVDAAALHEAFASAAAGALPRLKEGRSGPISVSLYVDRKRSALRVTVQRTDATGTRTWPLVTREGSAFARRGEGSGPSEAEGPVVV